MAGVARNKGFEAFLPLYRCRRRWSDRVKVMELPLFPGYVFCRLNVQYRFPLLTIPGALHFVGVGKTPAPIDDVEIRAIQTLVQSDMQTEPWPFLEAGERVRLEYGPLAGLEGFFVEARNQRRIVVSVSLLRRSIAVEIEQEWVTPLDAAWREITQFGDRLDSYRQQLCAPSGPALGDSVP